jgi:ABC-type transport system substrate-binding protein
MKVSIFVKNFMLISLTFAFIFGVLAGCSSSESTTPATAPKNPESQSSNKTGPQYGGTVKIRTNSQISTYGYPPEQIVASTANTIASPALETLGRYDSEGNMVPWLAKNWKTDPANLAITIELNQGIKFHDDTDFNAEAVKWNIGKWIEAKRPEVMNIKSVEAADSYHVKINLKTWQIATLDDLLWMVQMISPTAYEKNGKEWMMAHPIGTGPFKLDSYQPDVLIKFIKNNNYWKKGLPYLDSVEWRIITDQLTANNTFLGGEVDINLYMTGEIIEQYKNRTNQFDIVELKSSLGLISNGVISDSANPDSPFAHVKVRQALGYAINREEIAKTIFRGYVTPTNQFGAPGVWTYNPDVDPYHYNPEKAKQLLAEAGYPNGFKTKITGMPQHNSLMQVIQSYLSKVGIKADIFTTESANYSSLSSSKWDGLMIYAYATDANITSTMSRHFGLNSVVWGPNIVHPDKVVKLIDKTSSAPDMEARKKDTHELQKAVYEEFALVTSLYVNTTPYLKSKKVHDDGFYSFRGNLFSPESMWIER